ncbi:ABC transporter ATP-binding protein [Paenibacillus sacheonensis]|uniref:ATP-binding cassette domain-containing protein n=1 Tax=Paenibacillus sacheonensis TaxID=742054 RepID=A0A7X5C145_9BACL|nr:ABC transporter ATP-binding protein [Paenibacillus sacheonensis]MBM7568570.1 ATP-binding cassette subfamily B protein [Paenibacillus sacheonensis]NBC72392.1 ATP-binding cassette domain-containing protein [Paenibacillus sacheonensis]
MNYLRPYFRRFGKPFLAAILFLTLEAMCDLLQPTLMSRIIDVGVQNKDLDYVVRFGGYMLLVTAFGAAAATARNIISSHVSLNFGTRLRSDLFRQIQTLGASSIDKFDRASLVTRLTNDVTQMQNFTNGLMRIFVKSPLVCIGSLIMAVRLNPPLSLVLAVVVPMVAVLIVVNMRVGFPLFGRVQKALDRLNGVSREYLSGVRVVKAFNRFPYESGKFAGVNDSYQEISSRAMRMMSIFGPGIMLTVNFGIAAVIWIGGQRVDSGHMQVGHIIAFINYMTQILFSLLMISNVFTMFVRAKASSDRIGEVFAEHDAMTWSEREPEVPEVPGSIAFNNVSFAYNGTESVLRGITLECRPGETIGIIGSTGSGKSTLVSLIPRFYDSDSGSVTVDGTDVREVDPKRLRERIAIVPQQTVLFTGTIRDNLLWGKEDATEEEMRHAAKMAQAEDFIEACPEGYETKLGQGGVNLSGGQKQRLSIARALVRQPSILILDDCTSAVDAATESRIKAALREYAEGLTCLLIAQRITSVMDAERIVVLDNGEIVGSGTHDELLRDCRAYQEIYRSQTGKEAKANV